MVGLTGGVDMKFSKTELDTITLIAKDELKEEAFREAIEQEKEKIRNHKPLWHRIWPWQIIIIRRKG